VRRDRDALGMGEAGQDLAAARKAFHLRLQQDRADVEQVPGQGRDGCHAKHVGRRAARGNRRAGGLAASPSSPVACENAGSGEGEALEDDEEDGPPRLPGGKFYMTPEGHGRLRVELAERRAERHRVVEVVSWAAGNGDRSENADYKEGKRRLREIDRRLRFLDRRLAHAEVVDPSVQAQRGRVFFGATVTYLTERGGEVTVTIVGVDEASMADGKISIGSPVALALLGVRVGDEVQVRTPRGSEVVEIMGIRYPEPHPSG